MTETEARVRCLVRELVALTKAHGPCVPEWFADELRHVGGDVSQGVAKILSMTPDAATDLAGKAVGQAVTHVLRKKFFGG